MQPSYLSSSVYHHELIEKNALIFKCENMAFSPFDELIISWNAKRPLRGHYALSVSILTSAWSTWIPYAKWGGQEQQSFSTKFDNIRLYQDTLELLNGCKGFGYRIKVEALEGANLKKFAAVFVCTSDLSTLARQPQIPPTKSLALTVPPLSQMALSHPRAQHLCSATSATATLRFLLKNEQIDPVHFATQAWDKGFDIFGNWTFNVAHAYTVLGASWRCYVARLSNFHDIITSLSQGIPVVVSVKGPLPGSAQPYLEGHLMVVTGYDALHERVLCMDPAFPSDHLTNVTYAFNDFIEAWRRRNYIAYLFTKSTDV